MKFSERQFIEWAKTDVQRLTKFILDEAISAPDLTFALESLKYAKMCDDVRKALLHGLSNIHPVIREGAIYGANSHLADKVIMARIEMIAMSDDNAIIREIARDAKIYSI